MHLPSDWYQKLSASELFYLLPTTVKDLSICLKGCFIQKFIVCAVVHFDLEEQASKVVLYQTLLNHRSV